MKPATQGLWLAVTATAILLSSGVSSSESSSPDASNKDERRSPQSLLLETREPSRSDQTKETNAQPSGEDADCD
jgi:hypothetical protein